METDKKCHSLGPLVYFSKTGNLSQIRLDPPTLAKVGILNCYFFIADFFPHSKVHQYLENFSSLRPTPLFFICSLCVSEDKALFKTY